MQVIKRMMIGYCIHKDIVRLPEGMIVSIYKPLSTVTGMTIAHVNREGEYIKCYELDNNKQHKIKYDRYVDLINLEALKDKQYDPSTANVFADFLEENGHIDAANLLRKEFPLLMIETNK